MQWNEALSGVEVLQRSAAEAEVCGVEYDSRRVRRGDVFVAMRGGTTNGNLYIEKAVAQGAAVVVTDSAAAFAELHRAHPELAVVLVERGRRALAAVSANIFARPMERLMLSAVTGTNGKTTTAFVLEQLLRSVGRKCVLVGTIENHVAGDVRESPHTTPESRDVLELFADGVKAGATEAVMEMSSHALEQERVWGMPVDVGIFTNLTQDHLDYHGTMKAYARAKARMFEGVGAEAPRVAVINAEDAWSGQMVEAARACVQVVTYGMDVGDWRTAGVEMRSGRTCFELKTPVGAVEMQSPLTGRVNVLNLLAASAAAWARGLTLEQIAGATHWLKQIPGRFQVVRGAEGLGITVVVDYAHTDDALRNLIALARDLVRERGGRVITLFGCGGDRDRTKRPKMGRAAGEGSDLVILTSDNPRSEEPMSIIEEALVGVRETGTECIVEEDRGGAIAIAIRAARAGDIVLLAGKGHERVQVMRDGEVPFDDAAVAAGVLREME